MGIFNRLGSVINSYFNDFGNETSERIKSSGDPDLDAAYEELNDFLKKDSPRAGERKRQTNDASAKLSGTRSNLPPDELREDFECLGVQFGADAETCKNAYKKLLKIHHPDRHAGHEGNFKKATAKSAKINAAWDRIEKYYSLKGVK